MVTGHAAHPILKIRYLVFMVASVLLPRGSRAVDGENLDDGVRGGVRGTGLVGVGHAEPLDLELRLVGARVDAERLVLLDFVARGDVFDRVEGSVRLRCRRRRGCAGACGWRGTRSSSA